MLDGPQLGTTSYYYDDNGNLSQILPPGVDPNEAGDQRYYYNQRNLLITSTVRGDSGWDDQATFVYDGMGNRVQQVDLTGSTPVTTTYANDNLGLSQVLVAYSDNEQTFYIAGLGLVSEQSGNESRYLLTDGIGSVRVELLDQEIINISTYEPFGNLLAEVGNRQTVYGYVGEQQDNSGLVYLRARYYDPRLRIFISRDPWGGNKWRPATFNQYTYALNNPLTYIDPSGEMCILGFSVGWGRDCTAEEVGRAIQLVNFISGFFTSPAFAQGFLYELVDSVAVVGPSTVSGLLEVFLTDTKIGQTLKQTIASVAIEGCGADPKVVGFLLTPYSSVVNNPDPYFQLGRATGRGAALALALGEISGGVGGTLALGISTGGISLVTAPATLSISAHGALVIGGVIAKEIADPLLLRMGVLLAAALDASAGANAIGRPGYSGPPEGYHNQNPNDLDTAKGDRNKMTLEEMLSKKDYERNPGMIITDQGVKVSTKYIYVIDEQGNIWVSRATTESIHHPDLVGGANTYGAGQLFIDQGGKIWRIDNGSGHYRPRFEEFRPYLESLLSSKGAQVLPDAFVPIH